MIKFFTNRELSQRLDINLAKWKRWSREFLPPDPLGGLQSGYARQYNPNEAFAVHLGGHLVANCKFSIPEAKQILQDIDEWLGDNGFYFDVKGSAGPPKGVERWVERYIIFFIKDEDAKNGKARFCYIIRGIISNRPIRREGFDMMQELYTETAIHSGTEPLPGLETHTAKTLSISGFLNRFVDRMNLDPVHYSALNRTDQDGS
jgi:hypothetical protein